jgi:hypothetical protein
MSMDRSPLKRRSLQRRAHSAKAPRVLTSGVARGVARRLREPMSTEDGYIVMPKFAAGPAGSVPPAFGMAALRALSSEQPRMVTPEEVYRMMSPSPKSTGWSKELAEDRENIIADDPWEGR